MSPPLDYGDAAAEYATVRAAVGIVDRRDWSVVEVTGRDRAAFLHALLSNEVKALASGQGCAATLLDIHGKVQALVFVWVLDDRIHLVTPPGLGASLVEQLDKYLFAEKVDLRDATGELALLLLAGPGADATAERIAGARPGEPVWSHGAGRLDGEEIRVVRGGGETGGPEVWLVTPASLGARTWSAALAEGARPVGLTALESLRIEAGIPAFGRDVDATVLLPEIPTASLVSHTKGCYPGQEVVVRIRDRGHVNRMLRGLALDGDAVPAPGTEVTAGGSAIGRVTSAVRSLGLARPIALAFVRREHARAGARVEVAVDGRATTATVSDLPFAR
ncbi:MAG: YgfZ/GcvT domain-containing protein [Candidatus Rokuibacteriota bacterium]